MILILFGVHYLVLYCLHSIRLRGFFIKIILFTLQLFLTVLCTFADADKFKIGVIAPLTGKAADYGTSIKNSITLAQLNQPQLFTNLEFIFEDPGYDVKEAVRSFKKLSNIDQVDLVYIWGAPFCLALSPLAEDMKIPLIAQCVDPIIGKNRKYVIRFMNHSDQYVLHLLSYLRAKGYKKFAAVLTDNGYLDEMYRAFQRNLQSGEELTLIDRFQLPDLDFRTTILKLRAGNYDALGVFLGPEQIAQFYKQALEQKITLPTFGTNFFESLSEIKASQGSMQKALYTFNIASDKYFERYTSKFNNSSQLGFGALAYEFATLVGELFNSKKSISGEDIILSFSNIKNHLGLAAGNYSFVENSEVGNYFEFPIKLKEVTKDSYKTID